MLFLLLSLLCVTFVYGGVPNEKIQKCCHTLPGIDKYCADKYCNFQAVQGPMVFPFIAECAPRGETVSKVWNCVSSHHDHSECCKNQGVLPFCMPFCKADQAVPTDMVKYGICVGEFEKFRKCFRAYVMHNKAYHETL